MSNTVIDLYNAVLATGHRPFSSAYYSNEHETYQCFATGDGCNHPVFKGDSLVETLQQVLDEVGAAHSPSVPDESVESGESVEPTPAKKKAV